MHFLRPYWLFALLPVWYMCWQYINIAATDNWKQICDAHLLKQLLVPSARHSRMFSTLLTLLCTFAVIGLSGPSWHQIKKPVYKSLIGTVITLNLSPSMSETLGDTSKVERARYKILDYLRESQGGLIGLIAYTDEAHVITPLTDDPHTIANFVPVLDTNIMPTQEDDTPVALTAAAKLLKRSNIQGGNIILVTDKVTHLAASLQKARELSRQHYHLQILNMSGVNDSALMQLAKAGGGTVVSLSADNKDTKRLLSMMGEYGSVNSVKSTKEQGIFWEDNGYYFVFLCVLIAMFGFRNGVIW